MHDDPGCIQCHINKKNHLERELQCIILMKKISNNSEVF